MQQLYQLKKPLFYALSPNRIELDTCIKVLPVIVLCWFAKRLSVSTDPVRAKSDQLFLPEERAAY